MPKIALLQKIPQYSEPQQFNQFLKFTLER